MQEVTVDRTPLPDRLRNADELRDAKQYEEARCAYEQIADEYPSEPEPFYKLGTLHVRLDDVAAAEASFRKAIERSSQHAAANNNLGLILLARGDLDQAERCFRISLISDPSYLDAHLNLVGLLVEATRLFEAEYFARRAIELSPTACQPYARLAQVKRASGKITEAIRFFEKALEMDSASVAALTDLGGCLWNLGQHEHAERVLLRAISKDPEFIPAWSNLLLMSNYRLAERQHVFQLHRDFGQMIRRRCGDLPSTVDSATTVRPDSRRRLRIGFISADFRRHSVAYFLRPSLVSLDRRQFELYAYHAHRVEDEITWELKPQFHMWRDVFGMQDQALAELIRGDAIDILVDLSGHTAGARPLVIGRKPAPLIVHWLGYPNTIGLDCVDYRLTDIWVDPDEAGDVFSCERLYRLERPFLCYSAPADAPDVSPPPSVESRIVRFGSFNSRAKLSDECIAMWVTILNRVPNSRLVLKSMFGTGDEESRASLSRLFVSRGIAEERIDVLKIQGKTTDHLRSYEQVDIALDTFPYHGTTTTCEALWMGVPVVTLAGDRHAARVGVTIMTNLGFDWMIARTPEDYVEKAVALAESPESLAELRGMMRARMQSSGLMDKEDMGVVLGNGLRDMWQVHCSQFSPELVLEAPLADQAPELSRFHIGGQEAREGWKIIDCQPGPGVDFVAGIEDLSMFPDASAQAIYCSHVLEHVGQGDMPATIYGLYRMLAPGGVLYLSVPDLEILSSLIARPEYSRAKKFRVMRMLFGAQVDEFDFHRIGLTYGFLDDYLRDAGFSSWERVETFGLFNDTSELRFDGLLVSLNLVVRK